MRVLHRQQLAYPSVACIVVNAVDLVFVFAFTQFYPLLLLAAFCGTLSPSTNDNTPFSGIEQAVLAQSTSTECHTSVFAMYNLAAQFAGAIGDSSVGDRDYEISFGSDDIKRKLINIADATEATDAVTLNQLNTVKDGLDKRQSR